MFLLFSSCLLVLFLSSILPILIPHNFIQKFMKYFIAASAGLLLSFLILELLAHSFDSHDHSSHCHSHTAENSSSESSPSNPEFLILTGFLISFIIEFIFEYNACCPHSQHGPNTTTPPSPCSHDSPKKLHAKQKSFLCLRRKENNPSCPLTSTNSNSSKSDSENENKKVYASVPSTPVENNKENEINKENKEKNDKNKNKENNNDVLIGNGHHHDCELNDCVKSCIENPRIPTHSHSHSTSSPKPSSSVNTSKVINLLVAKFIHSISDGVLLLSFLKREDKKGMIILTLTFLMHEIPMNLASYTVYLKSGKNAVVYNMIGNSSYFIVWLAGFIEALRSEKANFLVPICTGSLMNMVMVSMMKDIGKEIERGCKKSKLLVFGSFVGGSVIMCVLQIVMRCFE